AGAGEIEQLQMQIRLRGDPFRCGHMRPSFAPPALLNRRPRAKCITHKRKSHANSRDITYKLRILAKPQIPANVCV
ncbi:hypothetical protein HMPREF0175_1555, partial [Bifidobacterium longum subsp. longum ATCC 55813]